MTTDKLNELCTARSRREALEAMLVEIRADKKATVEISKAAAGQRDLNSGERFYLARAFEAQAIPLLEAAVALAAEAERRAAAGAAQELAEFNVALFQALGGSAK